MYIAYNNNLPIQIIITKNKEHIFSLKTMKCNFGVSLYTYRSQPIYPSKYNTKEEFFNEVINQWNVSWNIVYNTNSECIPFIQRRILKKRNFFTLLKWNLGNIFPLFCIIGDLKTIF